MRLSDLAAICEGEVIKGDPTLDVGPAVVIDSRLSRPGTLFVAFVGEKVDGHHYLDAAAELGAAAALVTQATESDVPQIVVDDPVHALTRLGTHVVADARAHGLSVIGITGSSGKTTTKDIAAQLCEAAGPTVAPVGSFNNEIGMPVTAALCDRKTRFFVAEMGAQRRGEIARLCKIAPPTVGIVLNVGQAHVGEFGGVDKIVEAKGELVEALGAHGWAVLNADDHRVWGMRERTQATVAAFSLAGEPASAWAVWASEIVPVDSGHVFTLNVRLPGIERRETVELNMPGLHVVADALAALAAVLLCGADADTAIGVLAGVRQRSKWRLDMTPVGDILVVNDAYNANPESMRSSLEVLWSLRDRRTTHFPHGRTWVILGDMYELGDDTPELHRLVGTWAADADEIVAVGQYASHILEGAQHGRSVTTADQVLGLVAHEVRPGDVVLLKGSLSVGLGPIGDSLCQVLTSGSDL